MLNRARAGLFLTPAVLLCIGSRAAMASDPGVTESEVVLNVRASYRAETAAMVEAFVAMGRKSIGIFVQDDAYGASGRAGVRAALEEKHLALAADTSYPRGQAYAVSTATQVAALRQAKVDAIISVGSYQACAALIRDARNAGWLVPIHNVSFVGADQMLALLTADEQQHVPLTQNLIVTQIVPSYQDANFPLVRDYRAAIDRFHPTRPAGVGDGSYQPKDPYSFGSLEGYLSARVFLLVLERAGKDLTRQAFYRAAEGMGSFDVGLKVPAEFSPARHQALDSVWFTTPTKFGWTTTRYPARTLVADK